MRRGSGFLVVLLLAFLVAIGAVGSAGGGVPGSNGKLAYISGEPGGDREQGWYLHTINADGSGDSFLPAACPDTTGLHCENNANDVVWSPDGSKVAWSTNAFARVQNGDGSGGMLDLSNDTSQGFELTATPDFLGTNRYLTWSPDGQTLAIQSCPFSGPGVCGLYLISASQTTPVSQVVKLVSGVSNGSGLSFSPDGRYLAFSRDLTTPRQLDGQDLWDSVIEIYDTVTGTTSQLTTGAEAAPRESVMDLNPDWSPDGSLILFDRDIRSPFTDSNGDSFYQPQQLWVATPDGSLRRQLTDTAFPRGQGVFSPDCSKIAFIGFPPGSQGNLMLANADGSGEQTIRSGGYPIFAPAWQPLPPSGPVSCSRPPDPGPPSPPGAVIAAAGNGQATISWSPSDGNGEIVQSYSIYRSDGPLVLSVDGSVHTAVFGGLTNGTPVSFTVRAFTQAGFSTLSVASNTVTPSATPTDIRVDATDVQAGGSTSLQGGYTADQPLGAMVTSPDAGTVTFSQQQTTDPSPSGFSFFGQQFLITAPAATVEQPLQLTFTIDASLLGSTAPADVQVFRDGVPTADCADSSGQASPDPCIASRAVLGTADGGVIVTVFSSHASTWNFGAASADSAPPTISCGAADGLWHAADVTLACTASDAGSGLASSADASFSLQTAVAAGQETANAQTGSRQVCDQAGNCATAGPIGGNKVDKKGPTVALARPLAGASYLFKQPVTASYSCTDGGSGVAACTGTVANGNGSAALASGAALPTSYPGAGTLAVSSRDQVGNTGSAQASYSVLFAFSGFLSPVAPAPQINQVSSGKNIPVPFKLSDYSGASIFPALGLNVLVPGYPTAKLVACPSAQTIKLTTTTSLSGLRYDSKNARYEYDLPIPASWQTPAGSCRQISLKFRDGTTQSFFLSVK